MARIVGAAKPFRSVAKECSDSGTPDSLFFAKQKATQKIKTKKSVIDLKVSLNAVSAFYKTPMKNVVLFAKVL